MRRVRIYGMKRTHSAVQGHGVRDVDLPERGWVGGDVEGSPREHVENVCWKDKLVSDSDMMQGGTDRYSQRMPVFFQSSGSKQSSTVSPGKGLTHLRITRAEIRVCRRVEEPVETTPVSSETGVRKRKRGDRTIRTRDAQATLPFRDRTEREPGRGELSRRRETVWWDKERGGLGDREQGGVHQSSARVARSRGGSATGDQGRR